MDDGGRCDALAEWISESTSLVCLDLSDTDLRDTGTLRLSRGMKDAPFFEELRLSKNRLTTQVRRLCHGQEIFCRFLRLV